MHGKWFKSKKKPHTLTIPLLLKLVVAEALAVRIEYFRLCNLEYRRLPLMFSIRVCISSIRSLRKSYCLPLRLK